MDTEFLTVDEYATLLRVHRNTIMRMIEKGRISAFRIGKGKRSPYRIPKTEINQLALRHLEKIVNQLCDLRIEEINSIKE